MRCEMHEHPRSAVTAKDTNPEWDDCLYDGDELQMKLLDLAVRSILDALCADGRKICC